MSCKTIITDVTFVPDATMVTLSDLTPGVGNLASLLESLVAEEINVDMIAYNFSLGYLSFTIDDADLPRIIESTKVYKEKHPSIKVELAARNNKFIFYGKGMSDTPGVAAQLMELLAAHKVTPKLITTSETEISILVDELEDEPVMKLAHDELGAAIH